MREPSRCVSRRACGVSCDDASPEAVHGPIDRVGWPAPFPAVVSQHGYTALLLAVDQERPSTVELLLDRGADIEAREHVRSGGGRVGCSARSVALRDCGWWLAGVSADSPGIHGLS